MDLTSKSLAGAGTACAGFAVLGLIAYANLQPLSASPSMPILGGRQACEAYSGLPADWRRNPRSGMVRIEGGGFTLGTRLGYEEEQPELPAQTQTFWIDQTEVTVAQFASFAEATGYVSEAEREGGAVVFHQPSQQELQQRPYAWWVYQPGASWRHPSGPGSAPHGNRPVTLVTFNDALAYAKWLGRDLPTEGEWEYAAKAHRQDGELEHEPRNAQNQPLANFWQGNFPQQNLAEDGYSGLAPVGCFAANPWQLFDMIGNAWEQTKDPYTPSHAAPANAADTAANRAMVVKGGSHLCGRDFCVRYRPSAREAHEANLPISHIGFRTVMRETAETVAAFEAW
jgi:formylglycine-generating enzyme required for sulfatase activity